MGARPAACALTPIGAMLTGLTLHSWRRRISGREAWRGGVLEETGAQPLDGVSGSEARRLEDPGSLSAGCPGSPTDHQGGPARACLPLGTTADLFRKGRGSMAMGVLRHGSEHAAWRFDASPGAQALAGRGLPPSEPRHLHPQIHAPTPTSDTNHGSQLPIIPGQHLPTGKSCCPRFRLPFDVQSPLVDPHPGARTPWPGAAPGCGQAHAVARLHPGCHCHRVRPKWPTRTAFHGQKPMAITPAPVLQRRPCPARWCSSTPRWQWSRQQPPA